MSRSRIQRMRRMGWRAKLWSELQPKIVLAENVRQAFQYGESGNADAVITSWTLVGSRGGVMVAAELHNRQAGGVVKASGNQELGRRFLGFLAGPEGRAVLEAHGLFPGE